jgi:diazepam-binding inhibitor (GABA receptor modulator, acyl-CoA-binding protein)
MPAQQSAEFKKATEDSRKLKAKPTDNELLEVSQFTPGCAQLY